MTLKPTRKQRLARAKFALPSFVTLLSIACGFGSIVISVDNAHIGNPADYRSIAHGAKRGYDLTPLRARRIEREDFARFDWILAMDRSILDELSRMRPEGSTGHLGLFLDLAPHLHRRDVPDPHDRGVEVFETVLDLVEAASDAFVARLAADAGNAAAAG